MDEILQELSKPSWWITAFVAGFIAPAISGYLAIKLMLKLIKERSLLAFAYYCWIVGAFVMFCGDSMRADGRGLRGSNSRNNWNQAMADASVRKLAGLHPRVLCPGHGPAILDVDGRIRV